MQQLYGSIVSKNKRDHLIFFSEISHAAASFKEKKQLVASDKK